MLQHLVCIRDDAQTRPAYYKLIEECVSQIVLHKSGCDPDFRATQRFNIDVEPLIEQLVERGRMEDGASANGSMGMNAGTPWCGMGMNAGNMVCNRVQGFSTLLYVILVWS